MTIKLYENFRSVFYSPFYLVEALGFYRDEGLDMRIISSDAPQPIPGPDAEDIWWGGPMRLLVGRDQDPACQLVGYCEVVTRDPFFLIGTEPRPSFQMSDLKDCRLATVSEVPTPWMCLQDDLRQAGINPYSLDRIGGRTMEENVHAFQDGTVDVIQVFEPYVTTLLSEGQGHIWYVSASRGATSYTTLFANRHTVADRRGECLAMTRATYRMQLWLRENEAPEIAAVLAPYFPTLDATTLTDCINRYKAAGIWGNNPILPRDGFERLRDACLSGGLIKSGATYEDCIDGELALAAMQEVDGNGGVATNKAEV